MAAAAALRVATAGARAPGPAPRGRSRTCSRVPARAAADTEAAARERYARENNKGFHQARYAAEAARPKAKPLEGVQVRPANGDSELAAAAWMRARAFYVYPPERAFAGQRQQEQKAESELKRLREETAERVPQNAYAVLVAAVPCESVSGHEAEEALLEELSATDSDTAGEIIVGSIDVELTDVLGGQPLVGTSGAQGRRAYLSNVCTAAAARRRGVGQQLLEAATDAARGMGAEALYVHALYVNEAAQRAYEASGFVLEDEESVQSARNRGMCLDGIEGRARTVILRKEL